MRPATIWTGCYDGGWGDMLAPEAFAHPAKFSRSLIERIITHGLERGWWKSGDTLADPFGGVGTGGIIAAYHGLSWIGVELEPRFVGLARQNFAMHERIWRAHGMPLPQIIQGDSRRFAEIVAGAAGCVTSPPWVDQEPSHAQGSDFDPKKGGKRFIESTYGTSPGQLGRMPAGSVDAAITSPPHADTEVASACHAQHPDGRQATYKRKDGLNGYADETPGQLAQLPPGEVEAVVTSPPFGDQNDHERPLDSTRNKNGRHNISLPYGTSPGQLGRMPPGSIDAAVTSPPHAESDPSASHVQGLSRIDPASKNYRPFAVKSIRAGYNAARRYGHTEGQLAQLPPGEVEAVVTSPPFMSSDPRGVDETPFADKYRGNQKYSDADPVHHTLGGDRNSEDARRAREARARKIANVGQIVQQGNSGTLIHTETYWSAVRDIYTQCLLALKPGGYIVVVVKSYVKKGKLVDLPGDTWRLLQSLGFEPVERIHAMLVSETRGTDLFEGKTTKRKERKSFFRRLAEKKGSPRIDFEEVLALRKPQLFEERK